MAFSATVKFDERPQSSTKGKIVVTATESATSTDIWQVHVTITAPDDTVLVEATDFSGVGNLSIASPGTDTLEVDLPEDSNNKYLAGLYNVRIWTRLVTDGDPDPEPELIVDAYYDFCPHNEPGNTANSHITTSETLNCLSGALTGNDDTDYTALTFTRTERTLTIDPPAIDGRADVTATDEDVTITVAYSNVRYPITYDIEYTHNSVSGSLSPVVTILTHSGVLKTVDYLVDCGSGLCNSLACLKTYFDGLVATAASKGGWARLSETEKSNFQLISSYLNLSFMFKSCGNTAKQIETLNAAKALLGDCGCNCSDCDSTDAIPFTAA